MKIPLPRSLPRGSGIGFCVLVALTAGVANAGRLDVVAGAVAHVAVDRPQPIVSDELATDGDYQTLHKRSVLLGNLMTSDPVIEHVARRARLDVDSIAAVTRVTANVQAVLTEPDSERRASAIREAQRPYRLDVQPHPTLPTLDIYAQAPTIAEARALADAATAGLRDYEGELARRDGISVLEALRIQQLGPARGTILNGGVKAMTGGLTFAFVLVVALLLLLAGSRLRRGERLLATSGATVDPGPPGFVAETPRRRHRARPLVPAQLSPAVAIAGGSRGAGALLDPAASAVVAERRITLPAGDWPHTTRLLPWMVAIMMAIVWLVPFNVIELSVSLPIDLKLDRLILPFIVLTWLLTLAAGGPYSPRVRLTWIHVALGLVLLLACLSLVLAAPQLNQALELGTSVKKLTLLLAYTSFFVLVASTLRRSEVPAFLTYTLLLASLCALGTIWEYRFQYNVFYSLSDQLLPGIFEVGQAESSAVDDIGRRVVRGPAELPLEAVAMLTMALPVALVGLIGAKQPRERILYGLAAGLLLAAAVSTYRKSAFIAPISVVLALAYFRRRELLRLAPLGVLVMVLVLALSPGAVQSIASQLSGDRLQVATVSDRNSDYDAIRPDAWTHPLFGRGYGSYEHTSYRILDMELLRQLIEGGVLGLLAYIGLAGAILAVARRPIRARRPVVSDVALAAAAAAVAFVVVSMLFDVMSFPHTPYLVLFAAALLAVMVTTPDEEDGRAWS